MGQAAYRKCELCGKAIVPGQDEWALGLAYAGLGRRADALASFDRALELDPSYEPAILNRRVTEQMREGEPFVADGIEQVEYYADCLRAEPRPGIRGGSEV